MWQAIWPERSVDDVPIGSVTNGVHSRTWIGRELEHLLGAEEDMGTPDFARAYQLDDESLWSAHAAAKRRLFERLPSSFDPEALTIGFARRFATYKRADLISANRSGSPDCSRTSGDRCRSCSRGRRIRPTRAARR